MAVLNGHTYQPVTFDAIRIQLASPDKIREWSRGQVTKPETINYRTLKPEKDGLFCEKIFGPTKDWECHCGKYKKIRYKGVICDRCGVEVTKASVRRERMGHIELAAPVSHIWYFKGIPSRIGLMLDLSPRVLEKVLYFASYIVLDPVNSELEKKQILGEKEYLEAREKYGNRFKVGMGAEAIKTLLSEIDLDEMSAQMKEELSTANGQKKARLVKRLDVVEAFRESGNRPEWMILDCIPVIPPDLRPMVQLDGGRFATSDLNDLYRRIINRNNRLNRLLELGAPDIIVRNEKRMLQEAVDALIDNGRRGRPVTGPGNRALKSLSDMLKGKNGRFRQNLLGKRVDYSGRSVIVIGPELKIYQCGVPTEMAIELFKPFVMKELVSRGISQNIKNAKKLVDRQDDQIWDVLEDVIHDHPVMLNRAPTLHRLGIQAFEPILVEGKAIRLHPLVCTAFNADFDGDQMAIHLPLSQEAQAECRFLMLSPNNLLKPSDGGPVAVPGQDIVLGIYYLTQERKGDKGEGSFFKDVNEAIMAYENGYITLHSRITCRVEKTLPDGKVISGNIESTLGRFLFNEIIPQDLGFVDREKEGNELRLEVEKMVKKKDLKKIIERVINIHGAVQTAEVLDKIKTMGYKFSTRSGITVSVSDMTVPDAKEKLLEEAQALVDNIGQEYLRGRVTDEERYKQVIETWKKTDDDLAKILISNLDYCNNIFMMADSGARGSSQQIKQLAGMRGLMSDTRQRTIELPIKSNFREGLDVLEYFMSAHGARKGLSDTALRTADSGYLTRRMVDVSQELIIREKDCCEGMDEIPGMEVTALFEEDALIESFRDRIVGRFACEDLKDENGKVIVKKNHMITPARADLLTKNDPVIEEGMSHEETAVAKEKILSRRAKIRTILTCHSKNGICAKCYGANMATGEPVQVGEAVGVIAAQSIGEPGTQLTMRNFHTGGVATSTDITQGLPRVEELFEARKPKGLAIIAEFPGRVEVKDTKKKREVVVTSLGEGGEELESKSYLIPFGFRIHKNVVDGAMIQAGEPITEGHINPHDLLRIKGTVAVQNYMLNEVQKVYRLQGVDICDKHIEVIVRQMMKKVRIDEPGDSGYFPGTLVDWLDFEERNSYLEKEGKALAEGKRIMLGITKAALATDSFLSAASFQETTKVLTEAAIKGKTDTLMGLKENIIIGKLIPAGTGMKRYRNTTLNTDSMLMSDEEADALIEEIETADVTSSDDDGEDS
ncbi:MAG: DNA-directed RNA polymerase subunit beta' [Lachnospiraceae bacterium]|nr:DNA-directed RNA polymerase subunit beta' [Lachnospiraceae bacterium]